LVAEQILKVIYAPHKVFKEILQNPRYLGAFILLIIFVGIQVSSSYVVGSREYLERTNPAESQGDVWAQRAALWQANPSVTISNNTVDYINSTVTLFGGSPYFGTNSVEFVASNTSLIQMELGNLNGSVNCGAGGFKNLSLSMKIITPDTKPNNVSLYLNSLNASSFYYDLTAAFSNSTMNVWSNITVPVGSGPWVSSSNTASWENITGIRMKFTWPSSATVDLRVGALFFRGIYENYVELSGGGVSAYLAQSIFSGFAPFIFEWIILSVLLYIIIKALKGNATWKQLMVAVGFALVTLVIQAVALLVAFSTLPNLYYTLELLANVPGGLNAVGMATLEAIAPVNLASVIIQIIRYVWMVGLGTIITRDITSTPEVPGFSWMKSIMVSGASFLVTLLVLGFIIGI
jgi:hypothetical protein